MRDRAAFWPPAPAPGAALRGDGLIVRVLPAVPQLMVSGDLDAFCAAQTLSAFGSRITRTAIPIIAVGVLTASPWEAAVLAALTYAPYVLTGLLLGGLVERSNKVRLMIATDLVRFVAVLAVLEQVGVPAQRSQNLGPAPSARESHRPS